MDIIFTIVPIFAVIGLGCIARMIGFIRKEFLEPANRLVYYLAIPAMIFRSIAQTSLKIQLDITVIAVTLLAVIASFVVAWSSGTVFRVKKSQLGTFVQSSVHGNLGYIGLAVAFYYLGSDGLTRASIIAGFVMILQNLLAVTALQSFGQRDLGAGKRLKSFGKIAGNPVIISALAGILFSVASIPLPVVVDRILKIVAGMALPMALLVIGAALSFERIWQRIIPVCVTGFFKLMLLPGIGFLLYRYFNVSNHDFLPGLILLASPTATVAYVMAKEMNGDADFAGAAISLSTLLSAVTFIFWLNISAHP